MLNDNTYRILQNKISELTKNNPSLNSQYGRGILAAKSVVSNTHNFFGKDHTDADELNEMILRLQDKILKPIPPDLQKRSRHYDSYVTALNNAISIVELLASEITQTEIVGQNQIQYNSFEETNYSGPVIGKPGTGKSFSGINEKDYDRYQYQKECEEAEQAPVQYYR